MFFLGKVEVIEEYDHDIRSISLVIKLRRMTARSSDSGMSGRYDTNVDQMLAVCSTTIDSPMSVATQSRGTFSWDRS